MNLFVDYIQPLTGWLQTNPHWALFITFIVSLAESLAIVGSIVPGSVTMTAIGILAGSGIMRIDLTLLAATLGAVCGDSLSYALGYYYSEQLVEIWPFKKYPNLLKYGKDFFARHGGKSVLIGRFVGPLRSIIPVVAGILHMKQWRFLIANVVSGIGWSLLYVIPGVLIGAAGHELSAEAATRLFALIMALLIGIWLAGVVIKIMVVKVNGFLNNYLHDFWLNAKRNYKLCRLITPVYEDNFYNTAGLLLLTGLSLLGSIALYLLNNYTEWLQYINSPAHFFTQSFQTAILEVFFIMSSQFTSTLTLFVLFITCCIWLIYKKSWQSIGYIVSLIFFSTFIGVSLSYCNHTPRPQGLLVTQPGSSFPAINLLIGTAFYSFILFYINNQYKLLTNTFRTLILILLGLNGFAAVFLGDYWLTDVVASYLIGITVCLIHWLVYRKKHYSEATNYAPMPIILSLIAVIFSASFVSTYVNFKTLVHNHSPYHREFVLSPAIWWEQQNPKLPLYRLNRIGNRISLLNIQYHGDLDFLADNLTSHGWELHNESFFTKLVMRMNSDEDAIKLPLLTQLYENKRPDLVMTYKVKESNLVLVLTIWESNYNINETNNPIWIGTIHQNTFDNKRKINTAGLYPLTYLTPVLTQFTVRRVEVPKNMINTTSFPTAPYILLIKQQEH